MITDLSIEQLRDLKVKLAGIEKELKREIKEINKEIKERLVKNGRAKHKKRTI